MPYLGAPIINGTNQLPKPPINAGITKKKIIKTHDLLQLHYINDNYNLKT
jgi:hypothetical protein